MATKKLSDLEWVKLSASKDGCRPILTGYHVREGGMVEATDSRRVHRVQVSGMPTGLWSSKLGAPIDCNYPQIDQVIPVEAANLTVVDVDELLAVCAASLAYSRARRVTLAPISFDHPNGEDRVLLGAPYVLDAFRIDRPLNRVNLYAQSGTSCVTRFDFDDTTLAVIMSIRNLDRQANPRFHLGHEVIQPMGGDAEQGGAA